MTRKFPKFGYNPVTGEWNDSLAGEFLWSNVNLNEAVPDVMTPSTWSLWWIFHYEVNPFEFPGDYPLCGNICGRPYLNLSLLVSMYRTLGKDVRHELQGDMIGSAPAELDIPFLPFSPLAVLWKGLPGLLKAQQAARQDLKQLPEFLSAAPGWCRDMQAEIQDCADAAGLLSLWMTAIRPAVARACRLLRGVTMTMAEPATKLRQDLIALAGEAEASELFSGLSGESGDLESLAPLVGLRQVQKGELSRHHYLERYGHRGPHEMELFLPDPADDPAWLDARLAESAQSIAGVEALLAKQAAGTPPPGSGLNPGSRAN